MWSNLEQNADAYSVLVIKTRILKGLYDDSLLYIKGDQMYSLLTRSDIANNEVYTEIYVHQVSYCLSIT